MEAFARAADDVGAEPGRLAKIERLAAYLRDLSPEDLIAATRFLTGNPLAAHDGRKIAIGSRTVLAAARRVWELGADELSTAYRATGDLGGALAHAFRPPTAISFFKETLTPGLLGALLDELASVSGPASGKRREGVVERIFRASATPREVAYAAKILTGELRIGLREGLVLDGIAAAFQADTAVVRRAAMAAGDVGAVAVAARDKTLEAIAVRYGAPIGFMLASPMLYGSAYKELEGASWLVEDKFDGIRAQAHKAGPDVRLSSRTFGDLGRAFPEVQAAFEATAGDFILDGEIVATSGDRNLPFRYLQTRLQRTSPEPELLREVPARFVAFDALALGDRFLLEEPLVERRALVAEIVGEARAELGVAPWRTLETDAGVERLHELFAEARERGNEGLMLKRADSPYAPGRRGKWWLKLKRELSTLDVVVVGVEWGHGKRKAMLSDYTFAVRTAAGDGTLVTIGKAYSGLTDAEIALNTTWFLAHRTGELGRHDFAVEPVMVIEVAFDIIQKSALHGSGFALRFPRIVRLRPDKLAAEADTLARVETIYTEMLAREGVAT